MTALPRQGTSLQEELRLHSRYIRDKLIPLLAKQPKLSHPDSVCVRAIFKTLDDVPMTLELLRYSRIHKALMVIAATESTSWPQDILARAKGLLSDWEKKVGSLKNIRADLYGPGGRMQGLRKIAWKNGRVPDDETKSAWSVEGVPNPSRAHAFGHLGFEVGDWWLKPAAAYRDGIIDETSHAITADENAAYAIVLTGSCETDLGHDREIRYQAAVDDPGVFRLTKTMLREDPEEKVVRVLRSWKLRSKIAPKAGLRYDGLYRILSFSVHLSPPNTWHTAFTLARIHAQPSLLPALHIPTSDQLDDWKDYQRLKLIDRGDDFAMLHEILAQPQGTDEGGGDDYGMIDGRHGSKDSGYYSRRGSKPVSAGSSRRESIFTTEVGEMMEGVVEDDEKAEEADDEGVGLEELKEEDKEKQEDAGERDDDVRKRDEIEPPTAAAQDHVRQFHPQMQIGTRFISPRKPAEPRLSAEEALVARARYLGAGQ